MASIIQAAKWMDEGKQMRRPYMLVTLAQVFAGKRSEFIRVLEDGMRARDGRSAIFETEDLLADDWEIAP